MPNWDAVATAFLITLAVLLPVLFGLFIFFQMALLMFRSFVAEILGSEVVQAIAGAAAQFSGGKAPPGGAKGIIVSKGMDILGAIVNRFTGG